MTIRIVYKVKNYLAACLLISVYFSIACTMSTTQPRASNEEPDQSAKEAASSKGSDTSTKAAAKVEEKKPETKPSDPDLADKKKPDKPDNVVTDVLVADNRPGIGIISLDPMVNPLRPQNEVYLGDWRMFLFAVDDEARKATGFLGSMTTWEGNGILEIGAAFFPMALSVVAYNDILPFNCEEIVGAAGLGECRKFEILVPPNCFDQMRWIIGPLEDAVWDYYRNAAMRHGEGWNTNQVDCATWIANMQALYLTDTIQDELYKVNEFRPFHKEVLLQTLRENQQLLIPTRPPICMSSDRHDGGTMDSGEVVSLPFELGEGISPCPPGEDQVGFNTVTIGTNAIVNNICNIPFTGNLTVDAVGFAPTQTNRLRDNAFMGVISHERDTIPQLDVSVFNTQLGNGRPLDSEIYKNACALTSVIQFDNTSDADKTLSADLTGVTFTNLFGDGLNTLVFLTSDGDTIVDQDDFWVIFYKAGNAPCREQVIAVELLGHREGDFRDNLIMKYDPATEDLFLGLRADYDIEGAQDDGDQAFLSYTIHTWDGSTLTAARDLRQQFASCYLAADPWAYQFFRINESSYLREVLNPDCARVCPLELAEFATRSQCFSNSRANQRWQNDSAGFWSMNSIKNVTGNIIINPGWLGPNLDVEVYVQKFDEAVFHGPRTVRTTDAVGQLMVELPTIVEGDRVLIKAQDNCCSDYDLIVPCVPEFTGFSGITGIPYVTPQAPPAL